MYDECCRSDLDAGPTFTPCPHTRPTQHQISTPTSYPNFTHQKNRADENQRGPDIADGVQDVAHQRVCVRMYVLCVHACIYRAQ